MSGGNPRKLRVAAELKRVANELLCNEINDPRLSGVRISAVELSGDLGVARFFYNTLDPNQDLEPVERALASARGFLRSRLGRAVRLRRVPELRFSHDIVAEQGAKLSRLIDAAVASEDNRESHETDDGSAG